MTIVVFKSCTPLQSLFLFSPLFKITLFFILLVIPCTTALSFNLINIGIDDYVYINTNSSNPSQNNSAYVSPQGIQVTSDEEGANFLGLSGKATYIKPLHLWDNATGNLTDFNTYFSFVINSLGNTTYGDGLVFFLAPAGSNTSTGGGIGLPLDNLTLFSAGNPTSPFVAVEFDTYHNFWDPAYIHPGTHVGINVNSAVSNVTGVWNTNITAGILNEAWISYDSKSYNLSVTFTGIMNNTKVEDGIHFLIDLRDYLPEWVTFGFCAATGALFETNNVQSWQFNSSFSDIGIPAAVSPPPAILTKGGTKTKISSNQRKALIALGSTVGLCLLALLLGFGFRKKCGAKSEGKFGFDMTMDDKGARSFIHSIETGSNGPKQFSYDQLSRATNNFSKEQKLGEGGFGGVYRGFLKGLNSNVAVKRISKESQQGIKEYASEVRVTKPCVLAIAMTQTPLWLPPS